MPQAHVGGSFAPPLTDELLIDYETLIKALPSSPVKDAMTSLLTCCNQWWDLPESSGTVVRAHPSGLGVIVPLDEAIRDHLDGHIPWPNEVEMYGRLFDQIDPVLQRELRNAAHHLLWHVKELEMGREPLTADKLEA